MTVAGGVLYTTQLQAGLGLVNETKALLELWSPGTSPSQLHTNTTGAFFFSALSCFFIANCEA